MEVPNEAPEHRAEVLPEFVVDVFSGWLRRDFLHRIARIAEGSA
jgi:hypothetical protein